MPTNIEAKNRLTSNLPPMLMNHAKARDLAEDAANEAIRFIHKKMGISSGDFAALHFSSDHHWEPLLDILEAYALAEVNNGHKLK